MSTITLTNYDSCEIEDLQQHEKMQRRSESMPVHRCGSAIRGAHRAPASHRTNQQKPARRSGMQCRRQNRSKW